MKLIRSIIFFVLLGYASWFCLSNFTATTLTVPLVTEFTVPQFAVILISLTVGIFIGYFLYSITSIRKSLKTREEKTRAKNLQTQLDVYKTRDDIEKQIDNSNLIQ